MALRVQHSGRSARHSAFSTRPSALGFSALGTRLLGARHSASRVSALGPWHMGLGTPHLSTWHLAHGTSSPARLRSAPSLPRTPHSHTGPAATGPLSLSCVGCTSSRCRHHTVAFNAGACARLARRSHSTPSSHAAKATSLAPTSPCMLLADSSTSTITAPMASTAPVCSSHGIPSRSLLSLNNLVCFPRTSVSV